MCSSFWFLYILSQLLNRICFVHLRQLFRLSDGAQAAESVYVHNTCGAMAEKERYKWLENVCSLCHLERERWLKAASLAELASVIKT